MKKHSALEIARYVVSKCSFDKEPISNLQLQKILYCLQTKFLKTSSALFDDKFEAWAFGPVVSEVYYQYCGFGAIPINMRHDIKLDLLDEESLKIIDSIIVEKRSKEPWELVDEVHKPGGAWERAYRARNRNYRTIDEDDMKKYS